MSRCRKWTLPDSAGSSKLHHAGQPPDEGWPPNGIEEKVAHNRPLLRRVTDPFSKRPVVGNFQEAPAASRQLGSGFDPRILRKRPKKEARSPPKGNQREGLGGQKHLADPRRCRKPQNLSGAAQQTSRFKKSDRLLDSRGKLDGKGFDTFRSRADEGLGVWEGFAISRHLVGDWR